MMASNHLWIITVVVLILFTDFLVVSLPFQPTKINRINWEDISSLVNHQSKEAIKLVYENWNRRKIEFFSGLDARGASALLGYDSNSQSQEKGSEKVFLGSGIVRTLKGEEWATLDPKTCAVFATCLDSINEISNIPIECKRQLLKSGTITESGMKMFPVEWLDEASKGFISRLTGEHLNNLSDDTFHALVSTKKCNLLHYSVLNHLKASRWSKVTPECLASIKKLRMVKIPSNLLAELSEDLFSAYNGELHEETIKGLTAQQAHKYASLIPHDKYICKHLDIVRLSRVAISSISPRCLYGYLKKYLEKPRKLRSLWTSVATVFAQFPEEMMDVTNFISPKDYNFMPKSVIDKIFQSKMGLEGFIGNSVLVPEVLKHLRLSSQNFKSTVMRSGFATKILIKSFNNLPDDTFALFEAKDYENLLIGNEQPLSPSSLPDSLFKLLQERPNFGKIIKNLSRDASTHYCSLLKSPDEYFTRLWLREFVSGKCRSSLPFPVDSNVIFRAPELERGDLSWREFVKVNYESWLSAPPVVLEDLIQMASFCRAISPLLREGSFLKRQPDSVLKAINGKCAFYLYNFITPEITSKLSDNVFEYFTGNLFLTHLRLKDVTFEQLKNISKRINVNDKSHVFREIPTKELFSLDSHLLDAITLSQLMAHLQSESFDPNFLTIIFKRAFVQKRQSLLSAALVWCESRVSENKAGYKECTTILRGIINDERDKEALTFWGKCKIFKYKCLEVTLTREPEKLRSLLLKQGPLPRNTILSPDNDHSKTKDQGLNHLTSGSGMDSSFPKLGTRTFTFNSSGSIESWRLQIIKNFLGVFKVTTATTTTTTAVASRDKSQSRAQKFSWPISHNIGQLAGLLFGESLRHKIPPPFELSESFWALLMDPKDDLIDAFYNEEYQKERKEFCDLVLLEQSLNLLEEGSISYVRPDALTFVNLNSHSNIYNPSEHEAIHKEVWLHSISKDIENNYCLPIDTTIRLEFRAFVYGFFNALEANIHTEKLKYIESSFYFTRMFKSLEESASNSSEIIPKDYSNLTLQ